MKNDSFIIIYDTYCGWCYGAAPIFDALVDTGADVEVLHRHLFEGERAYRMADGKGELVLEADAHIGRLTGQRFSDAYTDNIVRSKSEVLDSGYTAQAAALVHALGARKEFAVRARLEKARYIDGVSAADRNAVVSALVAEGVDVAEAEMIGTPELQARARDTSERAAALMQHVGSRGVPTILALTDGVIEVIDHGHYHARPDDIARRVRPARKLAS